MDIKRIVICGGHLTPALAIIEEIEKLKTCKIIYIGRKRALEGDKALSQEFIAIKKLNIPFYSLLSGRLQRSFTIYTIPSLLKFPLSLIHAFVLLCKIKPKAVVSFGGYVALPICFAAWILGIPIITHEQTHILGLSNRIICRLAKVTCISWQRTKHIPKNRKIVMTGNPMRKSVISAEKHDLCNFGNKNLSLLYITGGSLGSRCINKIVAEKIPDLVTRFRVIHQCGSADGKADFHALIRLKESLPDIFRRNYKVLENIEVSEVGEVYYSAKFIISRSGANTVSEIAHYGKPAIFIPLPWSGEREQEYNAKELESIGSAIIISQELFTPESLIKAINLIMGNYPSYRKNAKSAVKKIFPDAALRIVKLLEEYI